MGQSAHSPVSTPSVQDLQASEHPLWQGHEKGQDGEGDSEIDQLGFLRKRVIGALYGGPIWLL
jgi:hypothetical protein